MVVEAATNPWAAGVEDAGRAGAAAVVAVGHPPDVSVEDSAEAATCLRSAATLDRALGFPVLAAGAAGRCKLAASRATGTSAAKGRNLRVVLTAGYCGLPWWLGRSATGRASTVQRCCVL